MPPSFPRRRAVHRDENDEERSSSALQARTLAQRDQRLVNPQSGATIPSIVIILKIRDAMQSNYWLRHGKSVILIQHAMNPIHDQQLISSELKCSKITDKHDS